MQIGGCKGLCASSTGVAKGGHKGAMAPLLIGELKKKKKKKKSRELVYATT